MKNYPLYLFVCYIVFTLSISFFGPMKYLNYDKEIVFFYMVLVLVFFSGGYVFSNKVTLKKQSYNDKQIVTMIRVSLYISIIAVLIEFMGLLVAGRISLNFTSSIDNYLNAYTDYERNSGQSYSLSQVIFFVTGTPKIIATVLGVYYYKILNKKNRMILVLYHILTIITYGIGHGKQKQIGEILIFLLIVILIKVLDIDKNKIRKYMRLGAFMVLSFIIFASYMQYFRYKSIGLDLYSFNSATYYQSYFDTNHFFFKIFGDQFGFGLASLLSGYLSMGYYGLSLSLKLPFVWTYGVGNSYSLSILANRIFGGESILAKTYLQRMEATTGWPALSRWHTIFPWLASDFTFTGALFIIFLLAFFYGRCWKDIVTNKNPISMIMFAWLTEGLIFVPANNQLVHGIDTVITSVFLITFWLLRNNIAVKSNGYRPRRGD